MLAAHAAPDVVERASGLEQLQNRTRVCVVVLCGFDSAHMHLNVFFLSLSLSRILSHPCIVVASTCVV